MWLAAVECVLEVRATLVGGPLPVNAPTTIVCAGVDTNGIVASNIGQFNSCTIVNGSLRISGSSVVRWALIRARHTC